jgi:hypothetical protein
MARSGSRSSATILLFHSSPSRRITQTWAFWPKMGARRAAMLSVLNVSVANCMCVFFCWWGPRLEIGAAAQSVFLSWRVLRLKKK